MYNLKLEKKFCLMCDTLVKITSVKYRELTLYLKLYMFQFIFPYNLVGTACHSIFLSGSRKRTLRIYHVERSPPPTFPLEKRLGFFIWYVVHLFSWGLQHIKIPLTGEWGTPSPLHHPGWGFSF